MSRKRAEGRIACLCRELRGRFGLGKETTVSSFIEHLLCTMFTHAVVAEWIHITVATAEVQATEL
jgi:hypothetical protein